MIKEAYCSYGVSKLLKEKGFNEKCRGAYHSGLDDNDNPVVMLEEWMSQPYNNDFEDETFLCSAPTLQMAMRWLREVHKIHIVIGWLPNSKLFFTHICDMNSGYPKRNKHEYTSYEEAVEAALKYSLENFI